MRSSFVIMHPAISVTCHVPPERDIFKFIRHQFSRKKETQSLFATNISSISGLFLPEFFINNYITLYTYQCVYVECMSTPYILEVTYLTAILMNDKTTIMIKLSTSCTILFFH